jgi:inward rectifier potassium channel
MADKGRGRFGFRAPKGPKDEAELDRDLGFGSVVASRAAGRLLNRDGSFNNRREGLSFFEAIHLYDALLGTSWPLFLGIVLAFYLFVNVVFAVVYRSLGADALAGDVDGTSLLAFESAFFFSVHTLSTVGYGNIVPASLGANLVMTFESVVGVIGIALTTGLVFARFSRPTAKILFSDSAVIAPYRDGWGFMFRIANRKSTQLIELEAQVMFSRMEKTDGRSLRRFYRLPLERDKVAFFPLAWTLVHPIDEKSPFRELDAQECVDSDAEILVLLKGIDEMFSQTVHARSSYRGEEVQWGAKFTDIFLRDDKESIVGIDLGRLSEFEHVPFPGLT